MRRFLLVVAVGAALLLAGPAADTAWAGKSGYSSGGGGRSFSSPSGRSYSSGSRGSAAAGLPIMQYRAARLFSEVA